MNKSTVKEIKELFDNDVESFSNIDTLSQQRLRHGTLCKCILSLAQRSWPEHISVKNAK